MRHESLRLKCGHGEDVLSVELGGCHEQLAHVRRAILAAVLEARDMEPKGKKPCGCGS